MTTTTAELLDLVYRYYPRGMPHNCRIEVDPRELMYVDTKEHCRLFKACARGRRKWPRWKAMIRRLGDRYLVNDESLHLLAGNIDAGYSGRVWVTKEATINVHVSLLGPYYALQLPGAPDEERIADEIIDEIEATYPMYREIPPEVGNQVVPDVAFENWGFGEHTINTLLFATFTWRDVHTYDPTKE